MTDRELLEAAAGASGIEIIRSRLDDPLQRDMLVRKSARNPHHDHGPWNPRDDDGDSRRLAVALRFTVAVRHHECEVFSEDGECLASEPIFSASAFVTKDQATDPLEACRLAVLCAAAAIGGAA